MRLCERNDLEKSGLLAREVVKLQENSTLKHVRIKLRKTQSEMACMFNVSLTTYIMWERLESFPSAENKNNVEEVLGISVTFGDEYRLESVQTLKERRKYLRLTQAKVAQRAGVSTVGYRLWETGRQVPGDKNKAKLESVLGKGLIYATRDGMDKNTYRHGR